MASNNNPTGVNQYKNCPPPDDPRTAAALQDYHRRSITNRNTISELLEAEHGIEMKPGTVARRLRDLKLYASGKTTRDMDDVDKRQLVLDQLAKDPAGRKGPRTIKERIASDSDVHLTRDYIHSEMSKNDPDGFQGRNPTAKKVRRSPLVSLGIHHEWSGDGHDKLSSIGFPIWGIRDKWSGKWLGLWVVPNNRTKVTIAYLYLSLVHELGGMAIQLTTDCGSETTQTFGLATALREAFAPHLSTDELPAHRFLRSIHNIIIERGWLQLRLQWGDNVKIFWEAGVGLYNPTDPEQYDLVQWLWPTLIQAELDRLRNDLNNSKVRKDKAKKNPSGVAPAVAYSLHAKYGGENCLQPVDRAVVKALMEEIGGEDVIRFVTVEYAEKAQRVYDSLNIGQLTLQNVWAVFGAMRPLML